MPQSIKDWSRQRQGLTSIWHSTENSKEPIFTFLERNLGLFGHTQSHSVLFGRLNALGWRDSRASICNLCHMIVTCTFAVLLVCWRRGPQARTDPRRRAWQLEAVGSFSPGGAAGAGGATLDGERAGPTAHPLGGGLFLRLSLCHAQSSGHEHAGPLPCQPLPEDAP